MKVALVYDRINKWGGAERVLLALHALFPNAHLYTSVYNKDKAKWAEKFIVKTSFLQEFPFAKEAHEYFPLLMPSVFESFSFDDYDLVISVTSESAKGIITKPRTLHICYCLTPTRYLWSGFEEYFTNKFMRILSKPAISYLRKWDKAASYRPDVYIAISEEVQKRIKKFYGQSSVIIHPPVGLMKSQKADTGKKKVLDYYLVVSRLVRYKRVDLAIKACNELGVPLKIVGVGSDLAFLKRISGPTIEFLGVVTDDELVDLYKGARALLFPGFEDFGIVMVESIGFGIPVIAYSKGGARDIIEHKRSGIFFNHQTTESLIGGIKKAESIEFITKELQTRAALFSDDVFKTKISSFIEKTLQNIKIPL